MGGNPDMRSIWDFFLLNYGVYSSPPNSFFCPSRYGGHFFFYGRHMFSTFFSPIAQNGQISKFTKYGHVVHHLIFFLKLINKKSHTLYQKMYFQPIINVYLTTVSIEEYWENRLRGYRVTKSGHSFSSVWSKLMYYTILKSLLNAPSGNIKIRQVHTESVAFHWTFNIFKILWFSRDFQFNFPIILSNFMLANCLWA